MCVIHMVILQQFHTTKRKTLQVVWLCPVFPHSPPTPKQLKFISVRKSLLFHSLWLLHPSVNLVFFFFPSRKWKGQPIILDSPVMFVGYPFCTFRTHLSFYTSKSTQEKSFKISCQDYWKILMLKSKIIVQGTKQGHGRKGYSWGLILTGMLICSVLYLCNWTCAAKLCISPSSSSSQ